MTAGGSKSYKRRRTPSGVAPKGGAGAGGGTSAATGGAGGSGAGGGGRSSFPSPPNPYEGLTAEEALPKIASDAHDLVPDQLYRLCGGLPRTELELMCAEAAECERALMEEIRILDEEMAAEAKKEGAGGNGGETEDGGEKKKDVEAAGEKNIVESDSQTDVKKKNDGTASAPTKANAEAGASTAAGAAATSTPPQAPVDPSLPKVKPAIGEASHFSTVNEMLASELTPPDRYFTVSALLGRLREPLDTPLPPNSALAPLRESQRAAQYRKGMKKGASDAEKKEAERRFRERAMERQRALLALDSNPVYARKLIDAAPLLACWKRISNHRSAAVFRKAVNPREAPGYTDRILFPVDLGLIRKMIASGHIGSFRDLHRRLGLICHNCVKYNGRESDYGLVTREFESYADDSVIDAVAKVTDTEAAAMAKAVAVKAAEEAAAKLSASIAAPASGAATMAPPPPYKAQRVGSSSAAVAMAMTAGAPVPPVRNGAPVAPPQTRPAGAPATSTPVVAKSDDKLIRAGVAKPVAVTAVANTSITP